MSDTLKIKNPETGVVEERTKLLTLISISELHKDLCAAAKKEGKLRDNLLRGSKVIISDTTL